MKKTVQIPIWCKSLLPIALVASMIVIVIASLEFVWFYVSSN